MAKCGQIPLIPVQGLAAVKDADDGVFELVELLVGRAGVEPAAR